jgi:hypothetical protein
VADGLPVGLCRMGGDRRDRLSTGVRIHLILSHHALAGERADDTGA